MTDTGTFVTALHPEALANLAREIPERPFPDENHAPFPNLRRFWATVDAFEDGTWSLDMYDLKDGLGYFATYTPGSPGTTEVGKLRVGGTVAIYVWGEDEDSRVHYVALATKVEAPLQLSFEEWCEHISEQYHSFHPPAGPLSFEDFVKTLQKKLSS